MNLAQRIKYARIQAGKTQDDIVKGLEAKGFKVTRQAVSQWESEDSTVRPDIDKLPDLAKLLKTSIDWLLTGQQGDNQLEIDDEILMMVKDLMLIPKDKLNAAMKLLNIKPPHEEKLKNEGQKNKDMPAAYKSMYNTEGKGSGKAVAKHFSDTAPIKHKNKHKKYGSK